MNIAVRIFLFTLFFILSILTQEIYSQIIVYSGNGSNLNLLAAKEARRYVYLRTDKLLPIKKNIAVPSTDNIILLADYNDDLLEGLRGKLNHKTLPGEFVIKSIGFDTRTILVISGYNSVSTLRGVYRFAEHLGIRFDLTRDILPDKKISLDISEFDEVGKSLFTILGILPFHDFPEGPDLWNTNDYMTVVSQLPKLGMNFIGLHNYHQWSSTSDKDAGIAQGPEPTVWIGLKEDLNPDGTVKWSYPAYYAHTHRPGRIWGFVQLNTGEFHAGAAKLFESNCFGSGVIGEKIPTDVESCNQVFDRTGNMLNKTFTHAKQLGVKTAVGTELPLGLEPQGPAVAYDWIRGIPDELQKRIASKGLGSEDRATVKKIYEGIFERIKRTHPLDYYWLWSWEGWARWSGSEKQIHTFKDEMKLAYDTIKEMNDPFQLAIAGWMIGKEDEFDLFDNTLPSSVPFYGLWDEALGFEFITPERPKWAATWLEEDWGLLQPQLNVDRVYVDARAALEKNCEGLIAKHWRTRVLNPNISAMQKISWLFGKTDEALENKFPSDMNKWIRDFYQDWAEQRFGEVAAPEIAQIFIEIETSSEPGAASPFEILNWDTDEEDINNGAPAAIAKNKVAWDSEKLKYEFVNQFEELRNKIYGEGNLERYNYWLSVFKSFKLKGKYGTVRYEFEKAAGEKRWKYALQHRKKMARLFENIITLEIEQATNSSDLGEILNLEILNWYQLVQLKWDDKMEKGLGQKIPDEANPSMEYRGKPLIMVDAVPTSLNESDPLNLTVRVMGEPVKVTFFYRQLGESEYKTKELSHVARGVYSLQIPPQQNDFEFFIEAVMSTERILYPATAPRSNKTVIIFN